MRLSLASTPAFSIAGRQTFGAWCFNTDVIGRAVYIMGPKVGALYQVTSVDYENPLRMRAIGIIVAKSTAQKCTVMTSGIISNIYTGYTEDHALFVGFSGMLQDGPPERPSSGVRISQMMAIVLSSTDIFVCPQLPTVLVGD